VKSVDGGDTLCFTEGVATHREEDSTRNVTFNLSASWVERSEKVGIFLAAATLVLFLKWAFGELNEQATWRNLLFYAIPAYSLAVLTCFRSAAGRSER
jgi:hypothetical protein